MFINLFIERKKGGGGSIFTNTKWEGWILGRRYPNGVGHIGFGVAGGCDSVTCERGWFGPKNQKPSQGSVLPSELWVGWFLGRGYPNLKYIGFEATGGCDLVRCCHGMNMVYCYFRRNRVVLVSNLLIPDIHC